MRVQCANCGTMQNVMENMVRDEIKCSACAKMIPLRDEEAEKKKIADQKARDDYEKREAKAEEDKKEEKQRKAVEKAEKKAARNQRKKKKGASN